MPEIFITGSSDGLGLLSAQQLIAEGHRVVLHARNTDRKHQALEKIKNAEILIADLNDLNETVQLAKEVNALGNFDAIIHNAGVYNAPPETIFKVNVLAPYVLTSLINTPKRLIYLSSGMHRSGHPLSSAGEAKNISYSDSKLLLTMLMKAVARKNKTVFANAVDPGWVPTKMGGRGAPDDLAEGYQTQIWLATSEDEGAKVSEKYFHHKKQERPNAASENLDFQERLLEICEKISGVKFIV